jgi:hypothetical protein
MSRNGIIFILKVVAMKMRDDADKRTRDYGFITAPAFTIPYYDPHINASPWYDEWQNRPSADADMSDAIQFAIEQIAKNMMEKE